MTVKVKIIFKKDEFETFEDIVVDMTITEYANLISAINGSVSWYTLKTDNKTITFQPSVDVKRVELLE